MTVVGVCFSIIFPIFDNGRVQDVCAVVVFLLLFLIGYIGTNWTIMCSSAVLDHGCSFQPVSMVLPAKGNYDRLNNKVLRGNNQNCVYH
jgi:hypothetical protein